MRYKIIYALCFLLTFLGVTHANDTKAQSSEKIENLNHQKKNQMNYDVHAPQYLYKILSPEDWQDSLLKNQVVISPLDTNFIHLATENQLAHVAQKFWKDKSYMILKLDPKKLEGRLIYETNPGGTTQYYHLYEGKIPLDAVIEVHLN